MPYRINNIRGLAVVHFPKYILINVITYLDNTVWVRFVGSNVSDVNENINVAFLSY